MDSRSNSILFNEGMNKARQIVSDYIYGILVKCCDNLVSEGLRNKSGFRNLTGNTITSYACGLFLNGKLSYFVCSGDSMKQPVRVKLSKGETFKGISYDGEQRRFTGRINTDKGYGATFSYNFLKGYKSQSGKGFEIVMCTGTEYSTYLEKTLNADVLTGTFLHASKILFNHFKPMT